MIMVCHIQTAIVNKYLEHIDTRLKKKVIVYLQVFVLYIKFL